MARIVLVSKPFIELMYIIDLQHWDLSFMVIFVRLIGLGDAIIGSLSFAVLLNIEVVFCCDLNVWSDKNVEDWTVNLNSSLDCIKLNT